MGPGWKSSPTEAPDPAMPFVVGPFTRIFNQGVDRRGRTWHVNDHCFVKGPDGRWHMIGITHPDPPDHVTRGGYLAHATAEGLLAAPWAKHSFALRPNRQRGETVLWAPHVIATGDRYFMFVCTGGDDPAAFGISLAVSHDLWRWRRRPGVLFRDGFQARDPMVLWIEEIGAWVMYYCATEVPSGGRHVVAYRTSPDLISWSDRAIAYVDRAAGTEYGPTESPFVVRRGRYFYLFIGPRPYARPTDDLPNHEHPGYDGTDVFRSSRWNQWADDDLVGHVPAHAAEVIRDDDGNWYVSHAGIKRGGLHLARLRWMDGVTS